MFFCGSGLQVGGAREAGAGHAECRRRRRRRGGDHDDEDDGGGHGGAELIPPTVGMVATTTAPVVLLAKEGENITLLMLNLLIIKLSKSIKIN